jgi:DNA-binding NarL/FixJ family response regulator
MFVLASADPACLDRWRVAFDSDAALVDVRSFDALAPCLAQLRPRAVLLDTRLPRPGAAHAIDQLLAVRPDVRIIAVHAESNEEQELSLFLAGARGVCTLDAEPAVVRQAIDAVLLGELWIRRGLVPKLVDSLTADRENTMNGSTGRFAILTPREIEIARLIGQGASNKRIARQLSITERTVKAHLTMIFRKTGADDRVKLALMVSRRH